MKEYLHIPDEIRRFFRLDGSRSLLIKGPAGTGKTTLALQIMEDLGRPESSFYLTTRVSDEALFQQFPWLKEEEMKRKIVDAGKILLESLYGRKKRISPVLPDEDLEKIESARKFLKDINAKGAPPEKTDRTWMNRVFAKYGRIPEIEYTYDRIDTILPEKAMIVIDSVEGLTHRHRTDSEDFITMLQKDLVENSNTDVIFVLEKEEAPELEYLVDGVVGLSFMETYARRIREISLNKLRSIKISQPKYIFTLNNGKFRSFDINDYETDRISDWEPVEESGDRYSTGISDLDAILGGGLKKGSYNVVELGPNVSLEDYYLIMRPLWLNFITHDRGIFAVLVGGSTPDNIMNEGIKFLGGLEIAEKYAKDHVRIVDYFSEDDPRPYILPLLNKDREELYEMYSKNLRELRGEKNRPIMDYAGFDTIEYLRGDTLAIRDVLQTVARTKKSEDIGMCAVRPGLKLGQEIMNLADTYIRLFVKDRVLCLYGIKPKTPAYAVVVDKEKGLPYVRLEPLV